MGPRVQLRKQLRPSPARARSLSSPLIAALTALLLFHCCWRFSYQPRGGIAESSQRSISIFSSTVPISCLAVSLCLLVTPSSSTRRLLANSSSSSQRRRPRTASAVCM